MKKPILTLIILVIFTFVVFHNIGRVWNINKLDGGYQYIEIYGEKIHYYDSESGNETIVLLSGFGTSAPILDFSPLIIELTPNYRVIVIECLGYGYSSHTKKPRTVENIIDEIHTVLQEIEVSQPYILMPHSISGIYSHYYASKYPEEVRAIIGIDQTTPEHVRGKIIPKATIGERLIRYSGIIRLAAFFKPSLITPGYMKDYYTKGQLKEYRRKTIYNYKNRVQIDEADRYGENTLKSVQFDLPESISLLSFISTQSHSDYNQWKSDLETYSMKQNLWKIVELDGPHYLHRTCSPEMVKEINLFFNK